MDALFISPILAGLIAVAAYAVASRLRLERPSGGRFLFNLVIAAALGGGISLGFTMIESILFEADSGYSAGNAPLGWILFVGPPSVAISILACTASWLFQWPKVAWRDWDDV
jgi:hypothetical protein